MATTNNTPTSTTDNDSHGTGRRRRPTVDEIRNRTLHHDRLWDIEDVATFIGFSVRFAEDFVKDPTRPQPRIVTRGGERRWSPTQWRQWEVNGDTTHLSPAAPADDNGMTQLGAL